ncbi:hypothetical protein Tco_0877762 [Tanacetum coccineum]|uniref:Uncharacterized protein n=1 Tax=Tanacetum coccineum TaxID=301880 RepID=A0ABQ5BW19_9ASTR
MMSTITDIRCVLTQKALDAFCAKFHILGEVHPILPNQNDTMHERPSGKIGLYTRFFDYANFRLPLSTFLVDVDDFACPASFPWHTAKHVTRDPDPVAADFNAQDYTTLIAHPSLFWKFPEAFLELEASVERLCDEGCSGNPIEQGDSVVGGPDVNIQPVVEVADIVSKEMAHVQSRRQGKRKFVVVDAGGVSHPPKKLRGDHGTSSGASVGASVSTTSERKDRDHTDSVAEPNLRTIGALTDPIIGVFSDLTGSDFLVGVIRTVINPDTDLQKVYVPQ